MKWVKIIMKLMLDVLGMDLGLGWGGGVVVEGGCP